MLGVVRGLLYLYDYCDFKIIYCDVKVVNIFLDEEFEVVVGDFGFVKFMDYKDIYVIIVVWGIIGYIVLEYFFIGKLFEKIDVFGFGIMLLEFIIG